MSTASESNVPAPSLLLSVLRVQLAAYSHLQTQEQSPWFAGEAAGWAGSFPLPAGGVGGDAFLAEWVAGAVAGRCRGCPLTAVAPTARTRGTSGRFTTTRWTLRQARPPCGHRVCFSSPSVKEERTWPARGRTSQGMSSGLQAQHARCPARGSCGSRSPPSPAQMLRVREPFYSTFPLAAAVSPSSSRSGVGPGMHLGQFTFSSGEERCLSSMRRQFGVTHACSLVALTTEALTPPTIS